MTASIVGMDQSQQYTHLQATVFACTYCTSLYCQGPLIHGQGCMRVGRNQFMPPQDLRYTWKRLSSERTDPMHETVYRD